MEENLYLKQKQPIEANNGLQMEGYHVWGGSIIKENGIYHLFASRWKSDAKKLGDNELDGYRTGSEIVYATSLLPQGPYEFKNVKTLFEDHLLIITIQESIDWRGARIRQHRRLIGQIGRVEKMIESELHRLE